RFTPLTPPGRILMTSRIATVAVAGIGLVFALACGGGTTVDTSMFTTMGTAGGTATCPSGATTVEDIADGTAVTLIALHKDDAYSGSEYESKMPLKGKVKGDLHNNDDCWFGGGFVSDDGTDFYFYKAAFKQ